MINKKNFRPCIRSLFTDNIPQNGNMDLSNADPSLIFYAPFKSNVGYWTKDSGWDDASYTRTSSQTYISPVNRILRTATANIPAVGQHGIELDGARTNLLRYSEDFTEWTAYDATILSTTEPDPAGGNTASKIQLDAVDKSRINTTQIVGTSGNPYTMSIYLRSDSLVDVIIGTSASATEQQSTVSVTTTWKRYDITVTSDGDDYPSVINRPGTSVKTVYVWGAQYQAGTLATAYIPTNGAAATQTTSAADTSGNGLQVDLTQRMIDCFSGGEGTLIQWVYLPWDSSVIPNTGSISFVSTDANGYRQLTLQRLSTGTMWLNRSSDGVSATQITTEFSSGTYAMLLQFSAALGKMRCGVYNPATGITAWSHATLAGGAAYRGFFPINASNKLRWFYSGTYPISIGGCALYDSVLSDDEVLRVAKKLQ